MVRRLLTRLRRDERGFTLIEQLVVAGGLIMIVGAIAGVVEVAERTTPQDTARALEVRDAQVGLDRMMRELRHAADNVTVSPNSVTADVVMRGRSYQVTYNCAGAMPDAPSLRRCMRTEAGASQPVIQRIANAAARPVFSAPNGKYVATTLEVALPAAGGRRVGDAKNVVLEGGIYLRNVDVTTP